MTKGKGRGPAKTPTEFLGEELKRRREAAGLSQDSLGRVLFCTGSFIGQLEAGSRNLQPDMARELDRALECGDFFQRLCGAVRQKGHAEYFADVAEHERRAVSISEYAPTLVPGLLQTQAYARAVIKASNPLVPVDRVEELVRLRTERGAALRDSPTRPLLWFIVHEHALRLPVGGAAAMAEQLEHIAAVAEQAQALVQVLPIAAGAHAAMGGSIFLMDFATEPAMVYLEAVHAGQLLDTPSVVRSNRATYDLLRAVALSPQASRSCIRAAAEDWSRS